MFRECIFCALIIVLHTSMVCRLNMFGKNTLRYDNTMETRLKIMIALCIVILFATLFVILISRIQQGKKTPFTYSIDDLTHDKHDTTDEQRKIHRRAAESEYWERKNIDAGIYA